ncbi:MAG: amidohydrolase [Firmicutes bacterium]|nr:amidohydrolase [Bacillota bacterium]
MSSQCVMLENAKRIEPRLIEIRRAIHMNPELGGMEFKTSRLVAQVLQEFGMKVTENVAGTGIVGLLRGAGDVTGAAGAGEKTVAIRADMDALPIQDKKDVPYRSRIPGVMHACGHDGHVAMVLGAAMLLADLKNQNKLPGNVKFIFQPAEEGPGGAKPMIEAGVLKNPRVDMILGIHIWPEIPAGRVAIKSGAALASTDEIRIRIKGEGGHGAAPHRAVDAIVVAAQVISALQTIVSREVSPMSPVVLTIGTIHGGYRHNVIADEVAMTGTLRTLNPAVRMELPGRIDRLLRGIAGGMRASAEFTHIPGYPPTVNDGRIAELASRSAARVVGDTNVIREIEPSLGGEDFSYFLELVPGVFIMLGAGNPEAGITFPSHHPRFDFDERALAIGAAILAQATFDYLSLPESGGDFLP